VFKEEWKENCIAGGGIGRPVAKNGNNRMKGERLLFALNQILTRQVEII
jgi:hypothetical protein